MSDREAKRLCKELKEQAVKVDWMYTEYEFTDKQLKDECKVLWLLQAEMEQYLISIGIDGDAAYEMVGNDDLREQMYEAFGI